MQHTFTKQIYMVFALALARSNVMSMVGRHIIIARSANATSNPLFRCLSSSQWYWYQSLGRASSIIDGRTRACYFCSRL
ncbi:hypothetical protein BDV36DRAFT_277369 [Aspergillus pseudocaelatus]|uniref:Secreted protein n=1 Tax=Aspergillus pseudocaelatus TaxID=1825620 RepID=A0ABQ6W0B6_9EURO|nr:hypothetical protein BDV36DRAFT_277369 [Aspergillus pseudocaelatus]